MFGFINITANREYLNHLLQSVTVPLVNRWNIKPDSITLMSVGLQNKQTKKSVLKKEQPLT